MFFKFKNICLLTFFIFLMSSLMTPVLALDKLVNSFQGIQLSFSQRSQIEAFKKVLVVIIKNKLEKLHESNLTETDIEKFSHLFSEQQLNLLKEVLVIAKLEINADEKIELLMDTLGISADDCSEFFLNNQVISLALTLSGIILIINFFLMFLPYQINIADFAVIPIAIIFFGYTTCISLTMPSS